jgi:uncharacterized membrane protein YdjX (TVP38/TMEM64 family)
MNIAPGGDRRGRAVAFILFGAGLAAFFALGGPRLLTFAELVAHRDELVALAASHEGWAPVVFVAAYLAVGLLGLPGSTVLNLLAGVLFGFWRGVLLVMIANTLAASVALLLFRYLFRPWVEALVGKRFPTVLAGLRQESVYLVFALRMVPVIPFAVTNVVLAVSPVPFLTCGWVTLVALLPRFLLYVYAGTQMGGIKEVDDLLSPSLIAALALLAVLPWGVRGMVGALKRRHARPS